MQNAPSVIYPAGHSAFYRIVLMVSGALAVSLIVLGWLTSWIASPWTTAHRLWAGGVGAWVIWAVLIWKTWPSKPVGALHWNAQAAPGDLRGCPGAWMWRWDDASQAPSRLRIALVLDGQRRILVRVHGLPIVGRWLWLEQAKDPLRWDDLRRALTAHADQT
jgi:hypothetical protein